MKSVPPEFWRAYSAQIDHSTLDNLKRQIESPESLYLSVDDVVGISNTPRRNVRALLDDLVTSGVFSIHQGRKCPACGETLSDEAVGALRCDCGQTFSEDHLPEQTRTYVRRGAPTRDVRWVITIHGMNTAGVWQQDFSWRLAQAFRYSIPVGIYKYGNVKFAPFLTLLRSRHRKRFSTYFRKVRREMMAAGFGATPDIIAHSFGTWLLSQVLISDHSDDPIRVGRVILTGSIVRPDFDWSELIRQGRVEAVLCHIAGNDFPARLAHWGIRGTGPSSVRGFNDRAGVHYVTSRTFGHSSYFVESNMNSVVNDQWTPFLTTTAPAPSAVLSRLDSRPWTPSPLRFVTLCILYLAVSALVALAILTCICVALGVRQLAS